MFQATDLFFSDEEAWNECVDTEQCQKVSGQTTKRKGKGKGSARKCQKKRTLDKAKYTKNQLKPSKRRKATEDAPKEVADSKETAGKDTVTTELARAHSRKSLIKAERKRLTDVIQKLNPSATAIEVCTAVKQQVPAHDKSLEAFTLAVMPSATTFLIEHLQKSFIELYDGCTGKDRYLNFQLKWHNRCGMLLVDRNSDLDRFNLHPSEPFAKEIVTVLSKWKSICIPHLKLKCAFKSFLILYCSAAFDVFLRKCHGVLNQSGSTITNSNEEIVQKDGYDVYLRFGGAALATMLHSRLKVVV